MVQIGNQVVDATLCIVFLNRGINSEFTMLKPLAQGLITKMGMLNVDMDRINLKLQETVAKAEQLSSSSFAGKTGKKAKNSFKKLDRDMLGDLHQETRKRFVSTVLGEVSVIELALQGFVCFYMQSDAEAVGAAVRELAAAYKSLDTSKQT